MRVQAQVGFTFEDGRPYVTVDGEAVASKAELTVNAGGLAEMIAWYMLRVFEEGRQQGAQLRAEQRYQQGYQVGAEDGAKGGYAVGFKAGVEHLRRTTRKKRYIERDASGQMVALIDEIPPSAEEAPSLPVKRSAA